MSASIGDSYREADILTAPPQRLHLMLIEGAIRFIERARHLWRENQFDAGFESLIRAQEIVAEILSGIKTDSGLPIARRVAALYTFVYRCLVEAGLKREEKPLEDALQVLAIQRETWQELCHRLAATSKTQENVQFSSEEQTSSASGFDSEESSPARSQPAAPHSLRGLTDAPASEYAGEYTSGFSWEA
ncbi:flagellar export chaperone FliS [Thermogutta sp.]|uniref:flagellar export chaperone FliS n=1 Tax=Thermogutta sp. TaxID=1962930 RepID=UPI00321FC7C9